MKYTKSTTFAVAFIMLAVGCIAFIGFDSDADNPVQVNDETVNVYFDGSGTWVGGEYEVFNVFEAIQAACGYGNQKLYIATASGDDDWTETTTANGTYPNPDYGTITTVGYYTSASDITYATNFEIYGCNNGDATWTNITPYALGWIRPFTDYRYQSELVYNDNIVSWASAFSNIAIKMKDTTSLSTIVTDSGLALKSLTDPSTRTDCLYTFILRDDSGLLPTPGYLPSGATFYGRTNGADEPAVLLDLDELQGDGIVVYGYGSDAYLALHYAINGAINGQEETYIHVIEPPKDYYKNYSWTEWILGVGTHETPYGSGKIYDYWATYKMIEDPEDPDEEIPLYAAFNLGYHTNIPGSYSHNFPYWGYGYEPYDCTGNTFVIQYERSYPPTS